MSVQKLVHSGHADADYVQGLSMECVAVVLLVYYEALASDL